MFRSHKSMVNPRNFFVPRTKRPPPAVRMPLSPSAPRAAAAPSPARSRGRSAARRDSRAPRCRRGMGASGPTAEVFEIFARIGMAYIYIYMGWFLRDFDWDFHGMYFPEFLIGAPNINQQSCGDFIGFSGVSWDFDSQVGKHHFKKWDLQTES